MARHDEEQAIARDLDLCDLGEALTRGRARKRFSEHRAACMAQIRAWNASDGLADMSTDDLLRELSA